MSNMKHLFKQMVFLTILLTFPLTGIHAQITIHMKNKPASEVVKQIEKVSKYRFFYKKGLPGMHSNLCKHLCHAVTGIEVIIYNQCLKTFPSRRTTRVLKP